MALAGTLLGQVFFGLMGDYLGRKKVYLHTLLLMIFATVAQAMSANTVKGIGVVAVSALYTAFLMQLCASCRATLEVSCLEHPLAPSLTRPPRTCR